MVTSSVEPGEVVFADSLSGSFGSLGLITVHGMEAANRMLDELPVDAKADDIGPDFASVFGSHLIARLKLDGVAMRNETKQDSVLNVVVQGPAETLNDLSPEQQFADRPLNSEDLFVGVFAREYEPDRNKAVFSYDAFAKQHLRSVRASLKRIFLGAWRVGRVMDTTHKKQLIVNVGVRWVSREELLALP